MHHPEGVDKQVSLFAVNDNDIIVPIQVLIDRKDGQHLRPVAGPGVAVLIFIMKFHVAALRVSRHKVADGLAKFRVGLQHDLCNGNTVGVTAFIGKQNPHRAAQNSGSRTNYQCEYQNHTPGSDQIDQGVYHRTGHMG